MILPAVVEPEKAHRDGHIETKAVQWNPVFVLQPNYLLQTEEIRRAGGFLQRGLVCFFFVFVTDVEKLSLPEIKWNNPRLVFYVYTCTCTHTEIHRRTHTHTHTHTHSLSLSLSRTHSHTHTHTRAYARARAQSLKLLITPIITYLFQLISLVDRQRLFCSLEIEH